ncbi:putative gamma-glutamylcyclotransferase At3g02910 [Pyrus x bretschneideri]|uniref:putative gamma-glutamylcyclotransferase At3g02910 n=1 Tax=Pyrus x bretschneideri TaxID=225117 RepID=UPI00202EC86B|nr:putative gamma-glutamylcyclotransferase At3g02910 [Pyrus x bretschneideri]
MVAAADEGTTGTGITTPPRRSVVFTYGTLKRGFGNHALMEELMRSGDAVFLGSYRTQENFPLVCGPYQVPFLLNLPGSGERVTGELYGVSSGGLARMDELEGTSRGHYERLPIKLVVLEEGEAEEAEAYFAHSSYARELWMKNGRRGLSAYSEKEARGYVKRNERPQHLTFLDHIQLFVSAASDEPSNSSDPLTCNE